MKQKLFLILLLIISAHCFSQVETVPAEHPVYPFLQKLHVQGILKNYDDVVIPLSKKSIIDVLNQVDTLKSFLSEADTELLERMKSKFGLIENPVNLTNNFPSDFSKFFSDRAKHLYFYNDSILSFYINPVVDYSLIYSGLNKAGSSLINLGGKIYGSYEDWFGFYLQGSNGILFGSRNTALYDPRVQQSYTFNKTGLNYFDDTRGYLRLEKGILSLQLGRERINWGTGYINKLLLSNNPPLFDFVKLNIAYKSLSYKFIHGWLVQKPDVIYIDSVVGHVKQKTPKYFAISRLGFNPSDQFSLGISQVIVYSNRPFEAAYLNPFLFWESAQRSMNDLDNSMLSLDGRYLITNGIELNASIIFDDLNFSRLAEGRWIDNTNGTAWQAGAYLTSPLLPDDLVIKIEYMQIRPYMFSHPGIGEALTYTTNGYLLGADVQPNSILFSAVINYRFSGKLSMSVGYDHYIHGNNIYDDKGGLIRNVGGNVFNHLSFYDAQDAHLLDGIRERTDDISFLMNYELTYGIYLSLNYIYSNYNLTDNKNQENVFRFNLKFDFE